jgi:hypothetical protein
MFRYGNMKQGASQNQVLLSLKASEKALPRPVTAQHRGRANVIDQTVISGLNDTHHNALLEIGTLGTEKEKGRVIRSCLCVD